MVSSKVRLPVDEKSLPRLQLIGTLTVVLVLTIGLGAYFIAQQVSGFRAQKERLESEVLAEQRTRLEAELQTTHEYIESIRISTEIVLRDALRQQVDQIMQMIEAIHRREQGRRSEAEIRQLIIEALRPMRFFDGRGYFFIDDEAGNCVLLPIAPEREGQSLLDNRDDTGRYIMRSLLEAARGDGFARYRWYMPGNTTQMADKLTYVRRFEPFGWIVGAGDYLYKMEDDLRRSAINHIRRLRINNEGYVAVFDMAGHALVWPTNPEAELRPLAELPSAQQRQIVEQLLTIAREGGGVARYQWLNPATGRVSPKLSVVRPYEAWNWVLVAGSHEDGLQAHLDKEFAILRDDIHRNLLTTLIVLGLAMLGAGVFSWRFSRWMQGVFDRYREGIEHRNRQLLENERQLRLAAQVFEGGSEGIVITDADNRILTVNQAFCTITGYEPSEVIGQNPRILASGRQGEDFYRTMWQGLQSFGRWSGEIWNRRKDGSIYPEWLSISVVRDQDGKVLHHIAVFSDMTERKAAEARARHLAEYDALTNLPNRILFRDRLGQAVAAAARQGSRLAVMCIDLDRFKNINDSLGHSVGDQVLCQLAERLLESVRSSDTVSRIGGDEFAVLLPDFDVPDRVASVAEKLLQVLARPLQVGSYELVVTPSIGIAVYPEDGDDEASLLKNADAAVLHAKEHGRNNFQFFTHEMNSRALERLELEHNLRQALSRGELILHYQPQYDLANGRLVGCEALLRWRHPDWGMVSPIRFIPLAEQTGMILTIGEWVLREACRQARVWQDAGLVPVPVSVNLSVAQFRQPQLEDMILSALQQAGLAPQWLELELTESVLMDDTEHGMARLARLKALGISVALDDFGTGYSSLAYLKKLSIDTLKIDRSFISGLPGDNEDAAIASAVIGLARNLGLHTVAEGVETEAQCAFLRAKGCERIQGYLRSPPVAAERFAELLAEEAALLINRQVAR